MLPSTAVWHTIYMTLKYWTGSHTKHRLLYHIVWVPKYRKRILRDKVANRLRSLLYDACNINSWWIDEIEILRDHVHILIQIRPDDKLSSVVKILKGGTSKIVRKEFPDLEEFLWGDNFWAKGFFAETVGNLNYSNVKKYIQSQNNMPQTTLHPRD